MNVVERTPISPGYALEQAARNILGPLGFAEIPVDIGILAEHLPAIKEGIGRLIRDPEGQSIFPQQIIATDEMGWDQEAGLVRRSGDEEKWFFHYIADAAWLPEAAAKYDQFLRACDALSCAARMLVVKVAGRIDAELKLPGERSLSRAIAGGRVVTRILDYLPREGAKPDATTHFDRSALTVHWYASHTGLVIIDRDDSEHRVAETSWTSAAVFPGKKYAGFFRGEGGVCGLHGVRDTRRTEPGSPREHRIAIVSFVHLPLSAEMVAWIGQNADVFGHLEDAHPL